MIALYKAQNLENDKRFTWFADFKSFPNTIPDKYDSHYDLYHKTYSASAVWFKQLEGLSSARWALNRPIEDQYGDLLKHSVLAQKFAIRIANMIFRIIKWALWSLIILGLINVGEMQWNG